MMQRSFPDDVREASDIRAFLDEDDFLVQFEMLCEEEPDGVPDFILLDFYLRRLHGAQVLTKVLNLCALHGTPRPVVIAHSSAPDANRMMLGIGADFALAKRRGRRVSPGIAGCFRSVGAVAWMKEHRAPPPAR